MKRSEAAKLRLSPDPEARSKYMASLARKKSSKMSKKARRAHAMLMVRAKAKAKKDRMRQSLTRISQASSTVSN